ncbi:hypothetical protein CEQ90_05685 [Lewinellaceae bacterium SD302]|nr:hypothetical protein CEQ90_05685 [Lewinellaceae bacterium SD302]
MLSNSLRSAIYTCRHLNTMKHTLTFKMMALGVITSLLFTFGCPLPPPVKEDTACNFSTPIYNGDSSLVEIIVLMNPDLTGFDLFGAPDTLYRCVEDSGDTDIPERPNDPTDQNEAESSAFSAITPWDTLPNLDCASTPDISIDTMLIGTPYIMDVILAEVNKFFFDDSTSYYFDSLFVTDSCECAEEIYLMRALVPDNVDINNGIAKGSTKTRKNGEGAVYAAGFNYELILQPVNEDELLAGMDQAEFDTVCPQTKGGDNAVERSMQNCKHVNFYPRRSLPDSTTKVAIIDTGADPTYNYSGEYGPIAINDYFVLTREILFPDTPASVRDTAAYGEPWSGDRNDQNNNCLLNDYYGYDFFHGDNNPADKKGHGSHLAYTVLTANQIPRKNVRVMPVQFGGYLADSDAFECDLFAGICAINYAVDQEVDIINLSWGYYSDIFNDVLYDQMLKTAASDILVVASVGNDSRSVDTCWHWPSMFSTDVALDKNTISVAALDTLILNGQNSVVSYQLAAFSNYGSVVDLAAPGTSITAALAGSGSGTIPLDGSSMATAVVARRAAILHRASNGIPRSAAELKTLLLSAQQTTPIATLPGNTIPAMNQAADPSLMGAIGYRQ